MTPRLLLSAANFSARGDRRQHQQAAEKLPVVLGNWLDGIGLASSTIKVCFGSKADISDVGAQCPLSRRFRPLHLQEQTFLVVSPKVRS